MGVRMDERGVAERAGRVEALLAAADERSVELARTLLELYGEALSRVMAVASAAGGGLAERIAADELVGQLLLLHGAHPVEARVRIERAVAAMGGPAGQVVEVVEVGGELARVRLRRAAGGCGSSGAAARTAVEEVVRAAAPEIERVEVEVVERARPPVVIPVESLLRAPVRERPGAPA